MTEFTIPANELARLTHNALAFMPARSAVKVCRLELNSVGLCITATDLFTVGSDYYEGILAAPRGPTAIDLSREDLQALDKFARGKKKGDIRMEIRHRDGMTILDEDTSHLGMFGSFLDASAQRNPEDLWERCDELLTRLGRDTETVHFSCLMLDPALFSRFGKVKPAEGKECIADLYFQNLDAQILVKIGLTFRGAIMPVDRDEAEASEGIGPEGLWE